MLAGIALFAFDEAATRYLGIGAPAPWAEAPLGIIALRILAIGILGPFAEELFFRGVLFFGLRNTRVGAAGAVVISALAFAVVHFQYEPLLLAFIFIDGLLLGLARWRSASLWVPMTIHMLGNLFSIYQSLSH